MTVDKINITSFGKLSDVCIVPAAGLNVIFAPNESGKTTLLSFIKFILYGTKLKKRKGDLSFKERYMPWSGLPMSGSIEITHLGKKYIISRTEGTGIKKLEIRNLSSGELVNLTEEPGKYFFSVGEKAFSDSCFVTDILSVSEVDEDLVSMISQGNTDSVSYTRARSELEERLARLSSSKRSGSELSIVKREKEKYEKELIEINRALTEIDLQIRISEKRISELSHIISDEDKKITESEAMNASSRLSELIADRQNEEDNIQRLKNQLSEAYTTAKNENKNKLSIKSKSSQIRSSVKRQIAFLSFFTVCFVLGFVFSLRSFAASVTTFALSGIFALLGIYEFFSFRHMQRKENDNGNQTSMAAFVEEQIKLSNARIKKLSIDISELQNSGVAPLCASQNNIKSINYFTKSEINGIINDRENHIKELQMLKMQYSSALSKRSSILDRQLRAKAHVQDLASRESDIYSKTELVNTSIAILDSAFAKMRDTFAPKLSKKAYAILSRVSPDSCTGILSDEKFNAMIRIGNEYKDAKSLSRGTCDLIYISLRLAMCDFLSRSDNAPVFFDDVLAFFDDSRCDNILKFFYELSSDRQIFLCTCRRREADFYAGYTDVCVIGL